MFRQGDNVIEEVKQRTEDAALWGSNAESRDEGDVVSHSDQLGSCSQEV